jgi:protein-tyrosine phosphatase
MRRLFSVLAVAFVWLSSAHADPGAAMAPQTHERVLGLQGATNFRDLGGYATEDGHHVRWGLIYRSNKLSALTPEDEARLDALHIRTEIDLRTLEERKLEPSLWLHRPADLYESPKESLGPEIRNSILQAHDVDSAHQVVEAFYARMPDLYKAEYAAFLRDLIDGEEPMVVHCTAGKDRTGVASAILLSALGVPRATVIKDYEMTETLLPVPPRSGTGAQATKVSQPIAAMDQLPDDVRVELWRSEAPYIQAALDSIDHEYGSMHGYLTVGLGLTDADIAKLRATLTD